MLLRNRLRHLTCLALPIAIVAGGGAAAQPGMLRAGDISPEAAVSRNNAGGGIVLAQTGDPRINELEEEIRRLTGKVEDLNFQFLQMQDQMRRMQEDYEFRFQELEQRNGGGSGGATTDRSERPVPQTGGQDSARAGERAPAGTGEPPRELGSITFDENGNLVSTGVGDPVDLLGGAQPDGETVAALPPAESPEALYRNAYEFILSGDYGTAEGGFRQYLDQFPDGAQAADAQFWLGESLLAQERYREAAEVFLDANKTYPSAEKAPEMLLKLGVSLAALGQQDVACATFDEIGARYPSASGALSERVHQERSSTGC